MIHAALQDAGCVIVVWSSQSIASDWVKDEAQVGRERGVLLPVCLDAVAPPLGFRQLQTVDLTDWSPALPDPAFEKLVTDIATMLGERAGRTQEGDGERTEETRAYRPPVRQRRLLLAGLAVVVLAVGAYALLLRTPEPPTERRVLVQPRTPDPPVQWPPPDDRVVQAVGRCQATWQARERILAADPGNVETLNVQADCGMVLVQNARITGNEARFRDVVDPITPVLYQALETAEGARAADLLAHLGMADFLRSRDGVGGLRPESFYRRALEQDPDKLHLWVLFLATFQELNGERRAARSNYESLRSELLSQQASDRLLEQTEAGLRRLSMPQ